MVDFVMTVNEWFSHQKEKLKKKFQYSDPLNCKYCNNPVGWGDDTCTVCVPCAKERNECLCMMGRQAFYMCPEHCRQCTCVPGDDYSVVLCRHCTPYPSQYLSDRLVQETHIRPLPHKLATPITMNVCIGCNRSFEPAAQDVVRCPGCLDREAMRLARIIMDNNIKQKRGYEDILNMDDEYTIYTNGPHGNLRTDPKWEAQLRESGMGSVVPRGVGTDAQTQHRRELEAQNATANALQEIANRRADELKAAATLRLEEMRAILAPEKSKSEILQQLEKMVEVKTEGIPRTRKIKI